MINIKLNDEKRRYDIIANKEIYGDDLLDALSIDFNTYPIPKTWVEAKCCIYTVLKTYKTTKMNSDSVIDVNNITFGTGDKVINIIVYI